MNFTEYFNYIKLNYIIDNYNDIKETFRPETVNDASTEILLQKYLLNSKNIDNTTNKINIQYKQKNENVGRFLALLTKSVMTGLQLLRLSP